MRYRCEAAVVLRRKDDVFVLRMLSPDEARCARCGLCNRSESEQSGRDMVVAAGLLSWNPREGDQVKVLIPDIPRSLAAFVVLIVPMGSAVAALFGAQRLGLGDWASVGFGALGFAAGWLFSYLVWGRRHTLRFEPGAAGERAEGSE